MRNTLGLGFIARRGIVANRDVLGAPYLRLTDKMLEKEFLSGKIVLDRKNIDLT